MYCHSSLTRFVKTNQIWNPKKEELSSLFSNISKMHSMLHYLPETDTFHFQNLISKFLSPGTRTKGVNNTHNIKMHKSTLNFMQRAF